MPGIFITLAALNPGGVPGLVGVVAAGIVGFSPRTRFSSVFVCTTDLNLGDAATASGSGFVAGGVIAPGVVD